MGQSKAVVGLRVYHLMMRRAFVQIMMSSDRADLGGVQPRLRNEPEEDDDDDEEEEQDDREEDDDNDEDDDQDGYSE